MQNDAPSPAQPADTADGRLRSGWRGINEHATNSTRLRMPRGNQASATTTKKATRKKQDPVIAYKFKEPRKITTEISSEREKSHDSFHTQERAATREVPLGNVRGQLFPQKHRAARSKREIPSTTSQRRPPYLWMLVMGSQFWNCRYFLVCAAHALFVVWGWPRFAPP